MGYSQTKTNGAFRFPSHPKDGAMAYAVIDCDCRVVGFVMILFMAHVVGGTSARDVLELLERFALP